MSNNRILLKYVSELLQYDFFIPSYQRGYRWTEQQVTDLLNDINEFSPKEIPNTNEKTWYCLQPIVVEKRGENEWDVIDGQQRLTTIFLVIHYMNEIWKGKQKINEFNLRFETRDKSQEFLKNILVDEHSDEVIVNDENIDFCFISKAYRTIHNWVKSNNKLDTGNFESKFIHSSRVIWYETSKDENSIDIFTRINSGKIPLTNAELIKALFLNRSNFEHSEDEVKLGLKQREIALEWDRIEYALQDDSFWCFINKSENNLATRIEFIFNLMSDKPSDDKYSTFHFFNEKFKTKSENEINDNWQEIKKYFQTLEEWYNDRELYHKIGYLIAVGTDIKLIIQQKGNTTKTEFRNWLENQITKVIANNKAIDELEYGKDNSQLIKMLLLHNVIATLNSEDISLKFPFDKYKDKKNGGWSLEHIHAQNSEDITKPDDFKEWLKAIDENELTEEIKQRIKESNENEEQNKIPQLVADIGKLFGEIEIHFIENMALLSKNDNSKLNNGLFPVKRTRVIELEKNGAFIPLATKKVFQKYYEGCTKQLSKWEKDDRTAYLSDIKETLKQYLPQTTLA